MKLSQTRARIGLPARVALLRIAFGVLWVFDAWFKWQPAFSRGYLGYLQAAASRQPAYVRGWFDLWLRLIGTDPPLFAFLTALTETLIALGLLLGVARRLDYAAGFVLSLLIWTTAEGFGGPYTAGSTDVGAAIIYAFVFAGLYGLDELAGHARLALDPLIERRWPPWRIMSGSGGIEP